ncbi:MAG TPA: pilus assembly protein TadG-related protein [Thermohalobaculum sp.]|nr:pilus assembly protein TadG-related protein [Thermohalobaculum sp.]
MSMVSFRKFLRDESGSYTMWSLLWFSIYIGIGGLAVDMTDAYRNETLLQATADASALAGAMSLPNQADAVTQALSYSTDNMNPAVNGNGNVLLNADVVVGSWNFNTRTFSTGGATPDAVLVRTRRSNQNNNPLATNFLRIMNLWGVPGDVWNIATEAIAVKYVPSCLRGGFIAGNRTSVSSGNDFINEICIHGQNVELDTAHGDHAMELQNDNYFETGVQVSMPNLGDLFDPTNLEGDAGSGLVDALFEGDSWPADVAKISEIIAGLESGDSPYIPSDVYKAGGALPDLVPITDTYSGPYLPNTVYVANCTGANKTLNLPKDTAIVNVVIVANCNISGSSGMSLTGTVLATSAVGNGANPLDPSTIHFASDANLGSADYCASGGVGGVMFVSAASTQLAAGAVAEGIRVIAGGNFEMTSNNDVTGISAQAGNDITVTSNSTYGLCPNGTLPPGVYAYQHRLVL